MTIPGWLGPIIGPIAGAAAYAFVCARGGKLEFSMTMLIGFTAIGLLAGVAMLLVLPPA